MGYVNKTVSKNETLIKQAKICKLSFLDRYIAGGLFALAGIFAIVAAIVGFEPVVVGEGVLMFSTIGMVGAGGIMIVIALLVSIYKLIQICGKVDPDCQLPGGVLTRLYLYGLLAVAVAALSVMLGESVICDVVNAAAGIVIGALIITFAILRYISIKLIVTDNRVSGRENIWMHKSFDLPIDKVDNILVTFSFWGKMFNFATITIKSVMGEYKIKFVKAPEEFKNLIIDFTAYDGE